jgi:hypothetical protein
LHDAFGLKIDAQWVDLGWCEMELPIIFYMNDENNPLNQQGYSY